MPDYLIVVGPARRDCRQYRAASAHRASNWAARATSTQVIYVRSENIVPGPGISGTRRVQYCPETGAVTFFTGEHYAATANRAISVARRLLARGKAVALVDFTYGLHADLMAAALAEHDASRWQLFVVMPPRAPLPESVFKYEQVRAVYPYTPRLFLARALYRLRTRRSPRGSLLPYTWWRTRKGNAARLILAPILENLGIASYRNAETSA